ncbi:tRNA pseudouridine(38-40) synthase TruA [Armatimonadetes bacterium Uphvl-Ar1]|nr:tRNA pseudouridine(38-40) synthase TruA [Armatimonadetes bacterium Uphvl-Ar1]
MQRLPLSSNLSTNQRIKLTVAYDGTNFSGWAPQSGLRTVQRTLKDGLCQVIGEEVELWGASRTDAGAHALGQVCHFDCPVPLPVERMARALNKVMPRDLSVVKAETVADDFSARFMARKRHYVYRVMVNDRNPLRMRFAHYVRYGLDLDRMRAAAKFLEGEHDFLSFSQEMEESVNTVRRLFRVNLHWVDNEVLIHVHGTAFVRGMMRRIAGSLVEVGRGNRKVEWIPELLVARDKSSIDWPPVLPACGLTLVRVKYGRSPSDHRFSEGLPSEQEKETYE